MAKKRNPKRDSREDASLHDSEGAGESIPTFWGKVKEMLTGPEIAGSGGTFPGISAPGEPAKSPAGESDSPAGPEPIASASTDSGRQATPPPQEKLSPAEQVHALLMHERVLAELETTQNQLEQERAKFQAQLRELEQERDASRIIAGKARAERAELEARSAVLRKSITSLQQQLQQEREAANDADVVADDIGADSQQLQDLTKQLQEQVESLRQELQDEQKAHQETVVRFEAKLLDSQEFIDRVRATEIRTEENAGMVQKALEVMEEQLREEREEVAARISELELQRDQNQNRGDELQARVQELEAELESASPRLADSADSDSPGGAEAPLDPTFAMPGVALPPAVAEPLYLETMAPLTVLMACVDIVLMSKKLDPSLRESTE